MSRETPPEIRYTDICGDKLKLPPDVLLGIKEKLDVCLSPVQCGGLEEDCWIKAKQEDEKGRITDKTLKYCDVRINGEPVNLPDNSC
ncbi:hypothetical protein KKF38_02970 [Patescibacteria group bacterium]|nr:hypothetical protein [Patescibacteria group bacterium]